MKTLCRFALPLVFTALAFSQQTDTQTKTKSGVPPPPKRTQSTMEKINNSQAGKTAAQQDAEREKLQPAPTSTQQATQPAPEMDRIAKLWVGRWRVTEKHEPSTWLPSGGQGSGMESVSYGPGRMSLIADYRSSGALGQFQGHAIFTWDGTAKKYRSAWTDSMGGMLSTRSGNWEGNDLVMTGTDDNNGQMTDFREVYTDFKDGGFTFYMEMSPAGKKQWKRMMTVTYTKLDVNNFMNNRMRGMGQRTNPPVGEEKKQ